VIKHCLICAEELFGQQEHYCSYRCRRRAKDRRRAPIRYLKRRARELAQRAPRFCPECGTLILGRQRKFCSRTCWENHYIANKPVQARPIRYCIVCNGEAPYPQRKFCSVECERERDRIARGPRVRRPQQPTGITVPSGTPLYRQLYHQLRREKANAEKRDWRRRCAIANQLYQDLLGKKKRVAQDMRKRGQRDRPPRIVRNIARDRERARQRSAMLRAFEEIGVMPRGGNDDITR
jgi:predicted nucleic acid-binding Zn ribbon protein